MTLPGLPSIEAQIRKTRKFHAQSPHKLGILSGLYRLENGLKGGNGERRKTKWKAAPSLTGAKMAQKWPRNGENIEDCLENPFPAHFWATFPFFSPISGFQAVFHSVQARQNPNSKPPGLGPTTETDPKALPRMFSETLLILRQDLPYVQVIIVSSTFLDFSSSCRTNYWNQSESYHFQ